MSEWEEYRARTGKRPLSGVVSIQPSGMTVAADVVETYFLDRDKDHAILLYSPDTGRCAIKAHDAKRYKLHLNDYGSARIQAKTFIRDYNIKRGIYPLTWSPKNEMLTFKPDYREEEGRGNE